MGPFAAGQVVIYAFLFPISRPPNCARQWCWLTPGGVIGFCARYSKSYGDAHAIQLADADFASGSLHLSSYVRPGKLFTAHASLLPAKSAD